VLILKDLEKLENGTVRMEDLYQEVRWTKGGWNTEKLPGWTGSRRVNAGHVDREEGKQFEAAK